jgi:uncharacterized protein (DUF1330 family)
MSVYIVFHVNITDQAKYNEYAKHSPRIIAKWGGRALVRGGNPEPLEGSSLGNRCVIVEFASREVAREFYHSKDYQDVMVLRFGAAAANGCIVDALAPSAWDAYVAESNTRTL